MPSAELDLIKHSFKSQIYRYVNSGKEISLIEEVDICKGNSRADLVVISDNLIGIEFKGPKDDLSRLQKQIVDYSNTFDKNILVIDKNLYKGASTYIPKNWGIILTEIENIEANFKVLRKPKQNLEAGLPGILNLLWKNELELLFLRYVSDKLPKSPTKSIFREELSKVRTRRKLKLDAVDYLKQRSNWRLEVRKLV